jgi:hypothetical protein
MLKRMPRRPSQPDRVALLALIAECKAGLPEGILRARGYSNEDMVALVRDGLATAIPERVVAGSRKNRSRDVVDHARGTAGALEKARR